MCVHVHAVTAYRIREHRIIRFNLEDVTEEPGDLKSSSSLELVKPMVLIVNNYVYHT